MNVIYHNGVMVHIVNRFGIQGNSGLADYCMLVNSLKSQEGKFRSKPKNELTKADFHSKKHLKNAWDKFKQRTLIKYDFVKKCYICGRNLTDKTMTFDHVIPISKGGRIFDLDNIRPCCARCNGKKDNLIIGYNNKNFVSLANLPF